MKNRLLILSLIMLFFSPYGCTFLIPEHETKTKAEFHIDKKDCDKQAWVYTQSLKTYDSDDALASQHLNYSRKCLKDKGWHYFK